MRVSVRAMGNSKGVLIFKAILEQAALQDTADLQVKNGMIEIRPLKRNPREGCAADSQRVAKAVKDALVWPKFPNADDPDFAVADLEPLAMGDSWLVQLDPTVDSKPKPVSWPLACASNTL